jgi:hypothetical protein
MVFIRETYCVGRESQAASVMFTIAEAALSGVAQGDGLAALSLRSWLQVKSRTNAVRPVCLVNPVGSGA